MMMEIRPTFCDVVTVTEISVVILCEAMYHVVYVYFTAHVE